MKKIGFRKSVPKCSPSKKIPLYFSIYCFLQSLEIHSNDLNSLQRLPSAAGLTVNFVRKWRKRRYVTYHLLVTRQDQQAWPKDHFKRTVTSKENFFQFQKNEIKIWVLHVVNNLFKFTVPVKVNFFSFKRAKSKSGF